MTCVLCQTSFSCEDLASLKAPLDIPIPDPAKEEAKRKKKEEVGPTLLKGACPLNKCKHWRVNTFLWGVESDSRSNSVHLFPN